MKSVTAICATLIGAALLAGGTPASADDDFSRSDLARMRAYEQGYRDALNRRDGAVRPPDIALDGKEGYSQSYEVHRKYLDRNGNLDRRRYDRDDDDWRYNRRYYDRDDYYERRLRRNDREEVVDFATQFLRNLSN